MPDMNYELAPKQGMTASQRKAELDAARFVAVRNLAYMQYKKPDGSALMTYQETLDNRELVKTAIINYEIGQGFLVNDLGVAVAPPTQQPQMQPTQTMPATMVAPNGAPMNQPPMSFQPPQQPQPQVSPQAFAQMPMAPQQPQPTFAPQMQPQPQFAPQGQPQMQAAPQAAPEATAAPTGKKRRAPSGASVAPPPAPPGAQYQTPQAPPGFQQQAPPQQQQVPVMQFQPGMPPPGAPMAAPGFAPPFQPAQQLPLPMQPQQQPQQAAPQQMMGIDLGPVISRIDDLGKGVMIAANNADNATKSVAALKADIDDVKNTVMQVLTAMHHMYLTNQTVVSQIGPEQVKAISTLNDFRSYLQKYIGSPK